MSTPTTERDVAFGRLHGPRGREPGSLPGIVLIHDVWGPSEHSRALAAELAGEGFFVLEIDLYRDLADPEIEAPGPFIRSLSDPERLAALDAAADWLRSEVCPGRKLGVMGVCMGGTYALLAACLSDRFSAAAPFYGILSYDEGLVANPQGRNFEKKPLSPLEAAERLRMPLLAAFGAEDDFIPVEQVRSLEEKLRRSGERFEVDIYAGAGHAFLNRTRPAAYQPEASRQAWARLIPFLHAELDGDGVVGPESGLRPPKEL